MNDMQLTLKKYPAYKDSGVEWLGEIPAHWEIARLGQCLFPISVKNKPDLTLLSITREKGVITRDLEDQEDNHNFIPDDLSNYKVIKKGQFGMNKMKAWQGSYGISPYTGIVSPAYYVFEMLADIEPEFFHIAIRSKFYVSFFGQASDGVRIGQWDLSKSRMKEIPFLVPPKKEQTAIATFLDEKTAKIDTAIAQKEKLIALLKERKQIIIQQAVTKGLDPTVKFKDSGVEWIGEIPAHWEISRSKWLFTIRTEKARPDDIQLSATQAYGVISQEEFMRIEGRRVTQITQHLDKRNHVEIDDFVISMRSFQGGLERAWETGCIRSSYVVLQPSPQINVDFFTYLFKSYPYIQALRATSNFLRDGQDMNFNHFSLVDLPLIPQSEQKSIAAHIETQSAKIERAINLQQQQIEKLKEYKAILISNAVTGKIKVC